MNKKKIKLSQYANLRNRFNVLVEYALGKEYYNMGMDVYACDDESCIDIMRLIWKLRHPVKAFFGVTPDFIRTRRDEQ